MGHTCQSFVYVELSPNQSSNNMLRYAVAGFALLALALAQEEASASRCNLVFAPSAEDLSKLNDCAPLIKNEASDADIGSCIATNLGLTNADGSLNAEGWMNYLTDRADAFEGKTVSAAEVNAIKGNLNGCMDKLENNVANMKKVVDCAIDIESCHHQ